LGDYRQAEQRAFQALKIAVEFRGSYYILSALVVIAGLLVVQGQYESALEILALAMHREKHAGGLSRPALVQRLYKTLQSALPPTAFEEAAERGRTLDERLVARELLAGWHPGTFVMGSAQSSLSNPLTWRELEILRLIAHGVPTHEVAETLYLNLGTVRWYLNQIYSKLDVHSRVQAIARARELKLLA
jgi:ATP/maltotriose-dependent transcriptional regulator MalT